MAREGNGGGVRTHAAVALAMALAAGCGGSSSSPTLTISPSTLQASAVEGTSASLIVTAVLSPLPTGAGPVYLGVQDTGQVLSSIDLVPDSAISATVTLRTDPTLAIGVHTGRLDFFLCRDATCSSLVTDALATVTYTITITAVPPPPPAAVITPSPLVATVVARQALEVAVDAQVAEGPAPGAYAVVDPQGIFAAGVTRTGISGTHHALTLTVDPQAAAGTYTGTLELQVCSYACPAGQLAGSPVQVPYEITVTPFEPLPPVPTASGLPEWETYQGNAGHTGFIPVTLDPSAFAPRWSWAPPADASGTLSPVTAGSGKVIVSVTGRFQPAFLYALDEADGSVAWRHDFGSIFRVNDPATAGGRVFVATSGHEDTFLWSFDLADGTERFKTAFLSQWESYLAPVFRDGYVYTDGGTYGGLYAFEGRAGGQAWFAWLGQYDLWSPAVDGQYVYAYTGSTTGATLSAIELLSGSLAFAVPDPGFNWAGYSLNMAPVLPGDGSVVLVDGVYGGGSRADSLIRYSVADRGEAWRVEGHFGGNPAVAAGALYVIDGLANEVQARDLETGALRWSWRPDAPSETFPAGNLVLTQNLLFVSSSAATYAVDLASRAAVWSTPHAGALALSSGGVLYVVTAAGTIEAFTLR